MLQQKYAKGSKGVEETCFMCQGCVQALTHGCPGMLKGHTIFLELNLEGKTRVS